MVPCMSGTRIPLLIVCAAGAAAVIATLLTLALIGTTPPNQAAGAAPPSCAKAVVRDWSDGRIDRDYSVGCYRAALQVAPGRPPGLLERAGRHPAGAVGPHRPGLGRGSEDLGAPGRDVRAEDRVRAVDRSLNELLDAAGTAELPEGEPAEVDRAEIGDVQREIRRVVGA